MNDKKISFIMCYNNEYYMQECSLYLSELLVPEGYEVDMVAITGAKSMTSGYNEGMSKTDAKYKIYLHQDVFITNKNFLIDMLTIFEEDASIGMIGMVGTPRLVKNGTMWNGIRFGGFYKLIERAEKKLTKRFYPITSGYLEVEAVDGLLMATQYNIPWREDVFQKWDFYDVSQCFEFKKAGYKVVVPGQNPEWYIHDCGIPNYENYNEECAKFLKEYSEQMDCRKEESWEKYVEQVQMRILQGFHGPEEERKYMLQLVEKMMINEGAN